MKTKINQHIIVISILISSLFVFSCEKEIDVDLRSVTPRLVIEGVVVKDSLAKVKLTKTKDFDGDNNYLPVSGAEVVISDDAGASEILILDESGWYVAQTLRGEVGRTYNLLVIYEEKTYTSTSTMPPLVEIDSITMYKFPVIDYHIPRIHFKDPKGKANDYYRIKLFIKDKYMSVGQEAVSTDQTDGLEVALPFFVDEKKLDDEKIKKGDKITFELQSVDKGAYTFFDTLGKMEETKNNPTSNISGGVLGYFSAYSYDRQFIIADW